MTSPEFMGLVQSLLATAEAAMGEYSPVHHHVQNDGLGKTRAKTTLNRSLGLLTMLAEKTRGNLSFEESDTLSQALARVRQCYSELEA